MKAHYAAILGLATALAVAIFVFHMPARMAGATAVYGAAYGLFPIGWIVLNVIFMYQLTVESGRFEVLQHSMTGITQDRRLQLLLIAFCFGAFFEGAAGFGTPVAVTAALLIGLGFRPLQASGLVADRQHRSCGLWRVGNSHHRAGQGDGLQRDHAGRHGRPHSAVLLLVPFWLIWAFVGFEAWARFGRPSWSRAFLSRSRSIHGSNYHGPWLVDIVAAVVSMICLIALPDRLASQAHLDLGRRRSKTDIAPIMATPGRKSYAPGCRGSFSASWFSCGARRPARAS